MTDRILASSTNYCNHLASVVVYTGCSTLQLKCAIIGRVCKVQKRQVNWILKLLLHSQINWCINLVTVWVELFLTIWIHLIIRSIILLFFIVWVKVILELEALILHERPRSAVICIGIHIIVLDRVILLRHIKGNLLVYGGLIFLLCDFAIFL